MSAARLLQLAGILVVTGVLVFALAGPPDMTVEFGGLLAGGALFVAGRALEHRARA